MTHPAITPFVENIGFEPMTPCLQSRCSSQLSYAPGEPPILRAAARLRRIEAAEPPARDGGRYARAHWGP